MENQNMTKKLSLNFGFKYTDLHEREGLVRLHHQFLTFLEQENKDAYHLYRLCSETSSDAEISRMILTVGPYLDQFIAELFHIDLVPIDSQKKLASDHKNLYTKFAKQFMQRRVIRKYTALPKKIDIGTLGLDDQAQDFSKIFIEKVMVWLQDPDNHADELEKTELYAAWILYSKEAPQALKDIFVAPLKLDPDNLIDFDNIQEHQRNAFHHQATKRENWAMGQVNYCLMCHHRDKDSCSKGLKDKDTKKFQKNALDNLLIGCPLEQKISEMNELHANGYLFAPLAAITIDNPTVAATGDRICNECSKACIFQKQDPVDIPSIESTILQNVLEKVQYGPEIYSLLTRWNPLNIKRPYPKESTYKKILVVGMGPAGFTLAHHLLQEGHTVVGIDGLKIEPNRLPQSLSWEDLNQSTEDRIVGGFGGVAEYGITVRWNKQKLNLIRTIIEQNTNFKLLGGVRLGESLTPEDAFSLGFDHVALCMGAGKPRILGIKNALAKGVRQASDFLMALQLTGAYKKDSLSSLTVRLPIVVIGGGLTAVDTATEALAYYPRQVKKFYETYKDLVLQYGKESVERTWTKEDREIASEFIAHAQALENSDNSRELIEKWGGATIAYRKDILSAPSYRLNHEELAKALQEGIRIKSRLSPNEIKVDSYGYASEIIFEDGQTLAAKTVLIAAGTQPNTVLAREVEGIKQQGKYFQAFDANWEACEPEKTAKPNQVAIFIHKNNKNQSVSFFGDMHPSFNGSVVKAMASAKQGYPLISKELEGLKSQQDPSFFNKIDTLLKAQIYKVNRLTPSIVEVIIKAPWAAKQFKPGQFFRLQNYEAFAPMIKGKKLAMEGLALTGAWADPDKGLISTVVLEMGASSRLCALLKPEEPVVLMGPTGTPTSIPENKTAVLAGGGLGNAVLFSIGQAMRNKGCQTIYFAAYKKPEDRFMIDHIESAADIVIWCCDEKKLPVNRPQDFSFKGNIVAAMIHHKNLLEKADQLIAIGSDRMMAAVNHARHTALKDTFKPGLKAIASINSPMQCMMKEICGQCIQRHVDPNTGKESYVFSCMNQDQDMTTVDFDMLSDRLGQNSIQEKLADFWILQSLKN